VATLGPRNIYIGVVFLGGWVIMSLGSERVLSRKIPFKKINIEFILHKLNLAV